MAGCARGPPWRPVVPSVAPTDAPVGACVTAAAVPALPPRLCDPKWQPTTMLAAATASSRLRMIQGLVSLERRAFLSLWVSGPTDIFTTTVLGDPLASDLFVS